MNGLRNLYFRFLRFSLGLCDGEAFLSGKALGDFDWRAFHGFCHRQALLGVAFEGVQRLGKGVAPGGTLLLKWFGASQKIGSRNSALNAATASVYRAITSAGYRCCILKGQGNALMYPNPHARTPGDIDVWVDATREQLRRLAATLANGGGVVGKESLNHIEMTLGGIAVELHSTPAILNNLLYNRRLQRWLRGNAYRQCANMVALPDGAGEVAVPTAEFNAVYQLFHLYHHYLFEGVGLRQFVDYYFVLVRCAQDGQAASALRQELRHLGLSHFAGAVMYVLREVFALDGDSMIAAPDERRGRQLLSEVMDGGNFGQFGCRLGNGTMGHNLQRLWRDLRLVRYYPAEALAEPLFRLGHFFWRLLKVKK